MKWYTIKAFTDIGSISQVEADKYFKPIVWGIKPIDLIPMKIIVCMFFDILQVFIPKLRLGGKG